jgi:hypothetical protein
MVKIKWTKSSDNEWYAKINGRASPVINIDKSRNGYRIMGLYKTRKMIGIFATLAYAKHFSEKCIREEFA